MLQVSDEKVTYSVSLEYPGASKFYAVKFTNAGSIDASFDAIARAIADGIIETLAVHPDIEGRYSVQTGVL